MENEEIKIIKKKNRDLSELVMALFFMIICFVFVSYLQKINTNNNLENKRINSGKAGLNIDMNKVIENPTTQDIQQLINTVESTNSF